MYRIARHLYDPYLPLYSYGLEMACENRTLLQWKMEMDLFAQGRSQRKIFPN